MSKKDGGPAFGGKRTEPTTFGDVAYQIEMYYPGMSLRDYFAGQALAGISSRQSFYNIEHGAAESSYRIADAMLEEREK